MTKRERIWYWDILRITSMVFLVIRHSATATFEFVEPLGPNWWVCNVYGSLSAWMVPVFMMISGCSFLDPDRTIPTRRLYQNNILKMFTFFAFWSLFYAVYNRITGQGGDATFGEMLFTGHFHLWFLPMIMGMYMLTPLLRLLNGNRKWMLYITVVTCLTGVIIPTLQDLGLFFDNTLVTDRYHFGYAGAYVAFFFLGYMLHRIQLRRDQRIVLYLIGIAATLVVFFGTFYLTLRDGVHNEDMQGDNNLFPALQGVSIFVLSKQCLSGARFSEEMKRNILDLSGLTFGVYMIHVVLLAFLDKLGFSPVTYPAAYMIPLLISFVLPTSFFLSWACRHIPLIGKHIV